MDRSGPSLIWVLSAQKFRHQFPTLILLLRTPMPYARFFGLLVQVGGVFQSRLLCTSPRLMCRSWAKTGRAYVDEKRASYPTFVTVCYGSTQNHQGEVMGLLIAWIVVSVWRHQSITDGDDDASPSADIALLHHMSPHYCHPIQWTVVTRLALKCKQACYVFGIRFKTIL